MSTPNPIVIIDQEGHVFTTSLLVAQKFNKQHKDVLKALRNLDSSEEFNGRNFAPVNYLDTKGESRPMYHITRDGFAFLAMGFTGKEAAKWKEQFINAFNRMEQLLTQALITEHHSLLEGVFSRRPQWRETVDYTKQGLTTGQLAKLQNKCKSSVRAMKARIRAAGIDLNPQLLCE